MKEEKRHYVYIHTRNDNGKVFYVGKGVGRRFKTRTLRNKWWTNIVNKHGFTAKIVMRFERQECAYSFEAALIRYYGKHNLCNISDGGKGALGVKQSKETIRKRIRLGADHHWHGKKFTDEHRLSLSLSHIGIMAGENNPRFESKLYSFWNFDGRNLILTKNAFQKKTGMTSSRTYDICNGKRTSSNGWYCSDVQKTKEEVTGKGRYSRQIIKKEITMINKDGRSDRGIPYDLMKKYDLDQGHFYAVIRGTRPSHMGWRLA